MNKITEEELQQIEDLSKDIYLELVKTQGSCDGPDDVIQLKRQAIFSASIYVFSDWNSDVRRILKNWKPII